MKLFSEKGKPIWETIKLDDFASIPDDYKGPRLDSNDPYYNSKTNTLTHEWVTNLQEWQKDGNIVHIRVVAELILRCIKIFKSCKNVEFYDHPDETNKDSKITVCGDVHGQYWDYLNIFQLNGQPNVDNPYLFNGDFVDRGSWSCEVTFFFFYRFVLFVLFALFFLFVKALYSMKFLRCCKYTNLYVLFHHKFPLFLLYISYCVCLELFDHDYCLLMRYI